MESPAAPPRLASIDVFRGLTMAAMLVVNNPGSIDHRYGPLTHAHWHGGTPTDLIFPFFLFIVGAAIPLSSRLATSTPRANAALPILRRAAILFALGLFLNAFPHFDLAHLRVMGILQRIAVVYACTAFIVLYLPKAAQYVLGITILLGYWALLTLVPVPGAEGDRLSQTGNIVRYVDRLIITVPHMYQHGDFEPEGLLSTLPAIVTALFGAWTGAWLKSRHAEGGRGVWKLLPAGAAAVALGLLWHTFFPINKQLWTSSYVVLTAGCAMMTLWGCHVLASMPRLAIIRRAFEVLGRNAIFAFVASGLVGRVLMNTHIGPDHLTTWAWLYEKLFVPWAGEVNGSLAFALVNVALWWAAAWAMDARGWRFKV